MEKLEQLRFDIRNDRETPTNVKEYIDLVTNSNYLDLNELIMELNVLAQLPTHLIPPEAIIPLLKKMNDMEAKPSSNNAPSNIAPITSAITRGNVTFLKTVLDNCPKHFKPDSHDDLYGDTHLFVLAINWSKNPTNPQDPHRKIGTFSKLMTNGIITKKDVGFGNLEPTAKSHHGLKEIAEATQQRKAAAHSDSGHSETPTKK